MIATSTPVMEGFRDMLTARLGLEFTTASKAYRYHDIPQGGIADFPAIRVAEEPPTPAENGSHLSHRVTLFLIVRDDSAQSEGTANLLDALYAMQAIITHALYDEEDTDGVLGGVKVSIPDVGEPTFGGDSGYLWMAWPMTLLYSRKGGEG